MLSCPALLSVPADVASVLQMWHDSPRRWLFNRIDEDARWCQGKQQGTWRTLVESLHRWQSEWQRSAPCVASLHKQHPIVFCFFIWSNQIGGETSATSACLDYKRWENPTGGHHLVHSLLPFRWVHLANFLHILMALNCVRCSELFSSLSSTSYYSAQKSYGELMWNNSKGKKI